MSINESLTKDRAITIPVLYIYKDKDKEIGRLGFHHSL